VYLVKMLELFVADCQNVVRIQVHVAVKAVLTIVIVVPTIVVEKIVAK
jgi:hypothetical protein